VKNGILEFSGVQLSPDESMVQSRLEARVTKLSMETLKDVMDLLDVGE
jgi:chemotaxis methyl-accepting protein methylase